VYSLLQPATPAPEVSGFSPLPRRARDIVQGAWVPFFLFALALGPADRDGNGIYSAEEAQ